MNKLKSIAVFCILIAATGNAQPVVTSSVSLPPFGYTDTSSYVSTTPTTNFGAAGANVTWDFSSFVTVPHVIFRVVAPASTPYNSSFPSASHALKFTSFGGTALYYDYWQVNNNALEVLGEVSSSNGDYYSDPPIMFPFPFSYLDTRTDVVQLAGENAFTRTITYDGYGTLIAPGATYNNVVRLRYDTGGITTSYKWFTTSPLMLVANWYSPQNKLYFLGKYVLTGQPCNDKYEPNGTSGTAKSIESLNDHTAMISSSTDIDWYSFSTSNSYSNIKVSLTNLPKNYTLTLYKNNTQVSISQNTGTTAETIIRNANGAANYKIKINGASATEYDAVSCYTLNIDKSAVAYNTGSARMSFTEETTESLSVYPNPAKNQATVNYVAIEAGPATISVMDLMGRVVSSTIIDMQEGINNIDLPLDKYKPGIYFLNVAGSSSIQFTVGQ